MTSSFTVACLQLNSGREIGPNVEATAALVRQARRAGADFSRARYAAPKIISYLDNFAFYQIAGAAAA